MLHIHCRTIIHTIRVQLLHKQRTRLLHAPTNTVYQALRADSKPTWLTCCLCRPASIAQTRMSPPHVPDPSATIYIAIHLHRTSKPPSNVVNKTNAHSTNGHWQQMQPRHGEPPAESLKTENKHGKSQIGNVSINTARTEQEPKTNDTRTRKTIHRSDCHYGDIGSTESLGSTLSRNLADQKGYGDGNRMEAPTPHPRYQQDRRCLCTHNRCLACSRQLTSNRNAL